jgi:choline transport protein
MACDADNVGCCFDCIHSEPLGYPTTPYAGGLCGVYARFHIPCGVSGHVDHGPQCERRVCFHWLHQPDWMGEQWCRLVHWPLTCHLDPRWYVEGREFANTKMTPIGFDGAIHLSEETERSAHVIPKVIVYTVLIKGTMAWAFGLMCFFSISDFAAVLASPTGFPLIEIMRQATRSREGATAIYALILAITFGSMFGCVASVSRLTWAFARDDGLPFSNYFKHVDSEQKIPDRAVRLVSTVIVLLSLINIGSSVALSAILSLSTIALYASYIIPITCLIFMRLRVKDKVYDSKAGEAEISEERLVFGPWNLGRWGMLINIYGVCYATLLVPFMALPTSLPLTAQTMNYAGPIFLFVLLFASVDYMVRGRKVFVGPRRDA